MVQASLSLQKMLREEYVFPVMDSSVLLMDCSVFCIIDEFTSSCFDPPEVILISIFGGFSAIWLLALDESMTAFSAADVS
jgi:hypothetical protein